MHRPSTSRRHGLALRRGAAALGLSTLLVGLAAASPPARAATAWPPEEGRGACPVTVEKDVPATMRDGAVLRADVYRPQTDRKVPVILMRTQYGKESAQVRPMRFQSPSWFASHCYLVVIQDIRGQYASGGTFDEYAHDRDDGYDTVEWAARLPGADGKVGMYGSSYVGATQWLAATATPPSLKTIVPSNTASDYYDGWTYENGAFRLGFIVPWMLETIAQSAARNRGDEGLAAEMKTAYKEAAKWMRTPPYDRLPPFHPGDPAVAPYFFAALRHPTQDAYWKAFSIRDRYARVKVPVLAFEGWYDSFLSGALENFTGMQAQGGSAGARRAQRMVIGPWEHLGWGRDGSPVSPRLAHLPGADSPVNDLSLAWFDHFLKGADNGVATGPRVDYYRLGSNDWHVAKSWPLPGTIYQRWLLASGGHAATLSGDGVLVPPDTGHAAAGGTTGAVATNEMGSALAPATAQAPTDSFVYDPRDPVPSMGGHSCCSWTGTAQGQFDQSPVEQRADVLVYTGPVLTGAVDVTGPVSVTLSASSDAVDTDFTAKLIDVYPDGTAVNISSGIQRASYRDSQEAPTPIEPGTVYAYTIRLWPTSNLFRPGHRIRVEISSSDFPQYDPNPNTGKSFATSAEARPARQTIHHEAAHLSYITLPVVPAGLSGPAASAAPQK